jgi:low temperature requirement protein LtrA
MTDIDRVSTPGQNYEVAPLELFFDLVFVFAVSQLSHHLLTHLSWRGTLETLTLLRAVYGVWYATSWLATMIPATEPRTRRMVLTVMVVGLFMNAAVTRAFTTSGWAFVIPLVLIQVGRTVWTVVNASDPIFREHFSRVLVWFVAMSPLWVVGAAVNPERRLVWWALAAGIDQIGAWLAHPLPGRRLHTEQFNFAGGHMLERCRLFLIIALGETVLTAGMALADAPLTLATIASGVAALVGTIALWTLGFGRAGQLTLRYMEETRDPARASRHAVSVLMVMVAGLIAVAVANEASIAHPREHMSTGVRLLLTGGPILYLLAQGWYYHVLLRVRPLLRLIGTTALGLLGIATLTVPTYIVLILFAASLSFLAVLDRP